MKQIIFPSQEYNSVNKVLVYKRSENSLIGYLELLWTGIYKSPYSDLDKKKVKVHKKIMDKIREVTQFKDADQDSRVPLPGRQILLLEDEELDLLKIMLGANRFSAMVSDDVDGLWELVDSAEPYFVAKPRLMESPG